MAGEICKHCGKKIAFKTGKWSGPMWRTDEEGSQGMPLLQYCWVDPAEGSQLHEPVKQEYTKDYDQHGDRWEIYTPDGMWMCAVNSETQADTLLSHLN